MIVGDNMGEVTSNAEVLIWNVTGTFAINCPVTTLNTNVTLDGNLNLNGTFNHTGLMNLNGRSMDDFFDLLSDLAKAVEDEEPDDAKGIAEKLLEYKS